jgi:putative endonuclease
MENKRSIGAKNEQLAAQYLIDKGYLIIERNFQCKTGEIDIIAKDNTYLVFVEVKYRTNTEKGFPEEAVDFRKIKKITRTAAYYMIKKGISMETACRFDVVSILEQEISLIQNAFDAVI